MCFSALQFRNFKIIYRRYAGLYFCICVDVTDNNLAYLEGIHNFVEVSLKSDLSSFSLPSETVRFIFTYYHKLRSRNYTLLFIFFGKMEAREK